MPPPPSRRTEPLDIDDEELLRRAREARNGDRFARLWAGELGDHGGDHSSADLALCGALAFWTGRDPGRMDTLFRRSGLMRSKWDERRGNTTYGNMTITKAISERSEPRGNARSRAEARPELAGDTAQEPNEETPHQWPEAPPPAVYHGVLGDLVSILDPHTEADPVAVLAQALAMFGNVTGRGAYYLAEADRHHTNIYACLVGQTAKGRKGTSHARVASVFRSVDPDWMSDRSKGGLSSGEGLIFEVRDGASGDDEDDGAKRDAGITDKRLLVVESEFASVLRVLAREGNTLSAVIRQAWETGKLNTLVKHSPTKATGAHISIIGHVTADELRRYLDRTEAGNGFANRILWLCVRRSKILPFGGDLRDRDLEDVTRRITHAVVRARSIGESRIVFDQEARGLWADVYEDLSEGRPGMLGAVTSRAEAQAVRLALLYALADCSSSIRAPHLRAALALVQFAEASARYVFGDALGDPLADDVQRLLRQADDEGMNREALREAFGRHRRSAEIGRVLGVLAAAGLARMVKVPTAGRPEERWYALRGKRTKRGKGVNEGPGGGLTAQSALTAQGAEMAEETL